MTSKVIRSIGKQIDNISYARVFLLLALFVLIGTLIIFLLRDFIAAIVDSQIEAQNGGETLEGPFGFVAFMAGFLVYMLPLSFLLDYLTVSLLGRIVGMQLRIFRFQIIEKFIVFVVLPSVLVAAYFVVSTIGLVNQIGIRGDLLWSIIVLDGRTFLIVLISLSLIMLLSEVCIGAVTFLVKRFETLVKN